VRGLPRRLAAPLAAAFILPAALLGQPEPGPVLGLLTAADVGGSFQEEVRRGAELALEDGGDGPKARLVVAARAQGWQAGAGELVRLVYQEHAAAVLGPLDGRSAHLAEQVVARAKGAFVLLSPWASEPALTRIGVPWFFRLAPDDRRQAEAILREIRAVGAHERVLTVVDPDDHESRTAAEALEWTARALGAPNPRRREAGGAERDLEALLADARAFDPRAVVLLQPPRRAAATARGLRAAGLESRLFGPLRLATAEFLDAAGPAAEEMVLAAPGEPRGEAGEKFRSAYRRRHGTDPAAPAAYASDGARVLLDALRASGGAGGEGLRRAIAATRRPGLTGPIEFEPSGNRSGPCPLARVEAGRLRDLRATPSVEPDHANSSCE
jgi:branched-chain amino acid transport system substrate-binding protein